MKLFPFVLGLVVAAAVVVRWRRMSNESRVLGTALAAVLIVYGTGVVHLPNAEKTIERVGSSLGKWTYLLVGAFAFFETGAFVGLVLPGETAILLGGVVAGQGKISVVLLIALVWVAAVAGDSVSYLLGRRLGRGFLVRHGPRFKITPERLERVERFFDRHGGKTILIGRFIGLVRALAPFLAGASRLPFRRFLPYDIVGCGLWGSGLVVLGYVFWRSFNQVAALAGKGAVALGAVLAVGTGVVIAVQHLRVPENRRRLRTRLNAEAERPVLRPLVRVLAPLWRRVLVPTWRAVMGPLRFVWNRVTPGDLGLELTTLLAVALVGGFVFGGLAHMLGHDRFLPGDMEAFRIARRLRDGTLTDVGKVLTNLGSFAVVGPVTLVAVTWLLVRRRVIEAVTLAAALGLTVAAVHIAKGAEDRPRPIDSLVPTDNPSYPSGHAAYAIAWVALAVVAVRVGRGLVSRTAVVVAGIAAAAIVGATRIYLRAHYLSDVLGGWALAAAIFSLCAMIALVVAFVRDNGSSA